MSTEHKNIAAVIPCFKVRAHILPLIASIGPEVDRIYVIDDCCPEGSGKHVQALCQDPRVKVIFHTDNKGVGGAVMSGYREAIAEKMEIVVKLDGDGQMDPSLVGRFIKPILSGMADYTKGNRFYNMEGLEQMPFIRLFGNSVLSFVNKLSSGYWTVMDPTNGYTAIHCKVLELLPLDKIEKRYFFESDLLFRLSLVRASVVDVPMTAVYGSEVSNLSIGKTALSFPMKYLGRFMKRIFYSYFLRDFNAASIQLVAGLGLFGFGSIYGAWHWVHSAQTHTATSTGVIMLAALPVILGVQFLIAALSYDVSNVPRSSVHTLID